VPQVVSFAFNATLGAAAKSGAGAAGAGAGFAQAAAFPLFAAGARRARAPWPGALDDLPAGMREAYAPEQLQLLCISEASSYHRLKLFRRFSSPAYHLHF
jgi:hypothetical protein